MLRPTDSIAHTTAFGTPVMEQEIAQSDDPSHHERTLLPRSYMSLVWMLQNGFRDSIYQNWLTFVCTNPIIGSNSDTRNGPQCRNGTLPEIKLWFEMVAV